MGYNIYKHKCCLCPSHFAREICIQTNYEVFKYLREFQTILKEYNPFSYLRMCQDCQMRLKLFGKCDPRTFTQADYQMQDSSHTESTYCQCGHCKAKFGDLPLLAEVSEKLERKSSTEKTEASNDIREQITEESKTDILQEQVDLPINYSVKDRLEENLDASTSGLIPEVQPSTSTNKETTVHRKIMSCEHCGKTFTHKGDMNKHIRKHTGEQPFSCPLCNRKFAHTSNLARHLKVHSGDKPYYCARCDKSFSRKDKLVMHQKTKLCMNAGHSSKS